jgi:hypothetical protein
MARHQNKPPKTFQQRQTEQRLRDDHNRAVVERIASQFACSLCVASDFAGHCEARISDLDFDLICSKLALDFWAAPPEAARPVIDVLRELEAERQRHMAALGQLRERLLELSKDKAVHQHLSLPIMHYQEQVRDQLFPGLKLRPAQNPAVSGEH